MSIDPTSKVIVLTVWASLSAVIVSSMTMLGGHRGLAGLPIRELFLGRDWMDARLRHDGLAKLLSECLPKTSAERVLGRLAVAMHET